MNLSSAGLLPRVKDALIELLPKSHYLFSNSAELQAWAKLLGWSDPEPVELIRRLVAMLQPEGFAVVTAGAHPTMVAHRGEVQLFPVPKMLVSIRLLFLQRTRRSMKLKKQLIFNLKSCRSNWTGQRN